LKPITDQFVIDAGVLVAGVDEAGRGPLAGPVMAAAVVLDARRPIVGLADSKTLSEARREDLAVLIRERSLAWCVSSATVEEIDQYNILQASLLAMRRAVEGLPVRAGLVLVDGNQKPSLSQRTQSIVRGDRFVPAISAASILAKVERDRHMRELDLEYPLYGFAAHKGYPTSAHIAALRLHGVSPVHRQSFSPVRKILEKTI